MFIKPGVQKEDPTQLLIVKRRAGKRSVSPDGEHTAVGDDTFWERRVRDGDVVVATPTEGPPS